MPCSAGGAELARMAATFWNERLPPPVLHQPHGKEQEEIAQRPRCIEACSSQNLTFLVTERGKPFMSNGFGYWFKDRCREASLPHCSAHGLRKAGATLAAENGATERQLMAMFGWRTSKMAEQYTRRADQKRLAGGAMHLIDVDRERDESVPLFLFMRTDGTFSGETAMKSRVIPAIGAQERTRTFTSCETGT